MSRLFNPFPGLRPFRSDEEHLFFGREEQTVELLGLLRSHRFTAVVGTSGSGKSSLVRAGLLPELLGGTMNVAGSAWEVAVLRPGGRPLRNLAVALCEANLYDEEDPEAIPQILATLNDSGLGLVEAARQSDLEPDTSLLVVVDQFEEIFRFRKGGSREEQSEEEEATAFVQLLLEASRQEELPIYVVLTMRSDYIGDCARFRGLPAAVNAGEYLIPQLRRDQLQQAIEGPVKVGGGAISYRLTQELLNDASADQDRLPVLQHALMRTWECWVADPDDAGMDLEHYRAVGTTTEALSRHADEIYAELRSDEHRRIAQRMFQALTERAADNRGIRRPTPLTDLARICDAELDEVRAVIEAFRGPGRTFLMPPAGTPLEAETVVDISHESLMRVWHRLQGWVDEEAESVRIYRRLAETAELHEEGRAGLYRDPDLEIALGWREAERPVPAWGLRTHPGFERAMAFLDTSRAAKEEAEREREAARARELEQAQAIAAAEEARAEEEQRSTQRLRRLTRVLIVLALGAIGASGFAVVSSRAARSSEDRAQEASAAAVEAQQRMKRQLYLADMSLVSQAYRTGNLARAASLLRKHEPAPGEPDHRGFEWYHWWRALHLEDLRIQRVDNAAYSLALSPDGGTLAVGNTPFVALYDADAGTLAAQLAAPTGTPPQVAFSADGSTFAMTDRDGVRLWDRSQPIGNRYGGWAVAHRLRAGDEGGLVKAIAFSPVAPLLATGDEEGEVVVWSTAAADLAAGARPRARWAVGGPIRQLVFGADGASLTSVSAAADDASRVVRRDLVTRRVLARATSRRPISALAASRFGNRGDEGGRVVLAVGYEDGSLQLWNEELRPIATLGTGARVSSLDFSADGDRLAVGRHETNSAEVWRLDRAEPALELTLRGHTRPVTAVAFGASRELLWTGSYDATVRRFDLDRATPWVTIADGSSAVAGRQQQGERVAFSADSAEIVYSDDARTLHRWQVRTGRRERLDIEGVEEPWRVSVSDDGETLGVLTSSGELRVSDRASGELHFSKTIADPEEIIQLVVANGGQRAAVRRGRATFVYGRQQESVQQFGVPYGAEWELPYFSPDGRWIASPHWIFVAVWDVTKEPLQRKWLVQGPTVQVSLAFSPDGGTVAVGNWDAVIRLRDADNGAVQARLLGSSDVVTAVAFSADGRTLAAGCKDGTVRLWDPESGRMRTELERHEAQIERLAFAPDSSALVSVSADGVWRFWPRATTDEVRDDHVDRAARLVDLATKGSQQEAWAEYREMVAEFPRRAETYRLMAFLAQFVRGAPAEAIEVLTAGLAQLPDHPALLAQRARAHLSLHDLEAAVADLDRVLAVEAEPDPHLLWVRGEAHRRLGRRAEAIADFRAALERSKAGYLRDSVRLSLGVGALVSSPRAAGAIGSFAADFGGGAGDGVAWRYTTAQPAAEWHRTDGFDTSSWRTGRAPFGSYRAATDWTGGEIWLRHDFEVDATLASSAGRLELWWAVDDRAEVYLNGTLLTELTWSGDGYARHVLPESVRLRPGRNVLAVHGTNQNEGARIDVGLYLRIGDDELMRRLSAAADPPEPLE